MPSCKTSAPFCDSGVLLSDARTGKAVSGQQNGHGRSIELLLRQVACEIGVNVRFLWVSMYLLNILSCSKTINNLKIYFRVQPTRRKFTKFIYFCEMLYTFQAVPPPIIRSSNCIYSIGYFVKHLLLPATIVEEMELVWVCCRRYIRSTAHSNQFHLVGCAWKYVCDARTHERQIYVWNSLLYFKFLFIYSAIFRGTRVWNPRAKHYKEQWYLICECRRILHWSVLKRMSIVTRSALPFLPAVCSYVSLVQCSLCVNWY